MQPLSLYALLTAAALASTLGCAAAGPGADLPPEDAAHTVSPDHLPTPFTADQIRLGNPPGTSRVFLITQGGEAWHQRTTFLQHPDGRARFEQANRGLDGRALGETTVAEASWEELQAHAAYLRADTVLREASCATAAGAFDCWLYEQTVTADDGATTSRQSFYFAKDLPGPPVHFTMHQGEEQVFSMSLVEIMRP